MSDIKTAYKIMRAAYRSAFYDKESRLKYCPIKKVSNLKRVNGVSVERKTHLPARTIDGGYGFKTIYVNDENGGYEETVDVVTDGKLHIYTNQGITTFRCGIMTCVAVSEFIYRMNIRTDVVGFIGCGRTNLMNCKAIKEVFGMNKAVIRGSKANYGKNADKFNEVVRTVVDDTPDFSELNKCNIVVVTTSNFEKENLISTKDLPKPKLLIVLDCGYTLDESFREDAVCYTDYKEQIESDYEDEFPFDDNKYDLRQLIEGSYDVDPNERVCVYLHGIGFADVMTAEMKAKGIIT